MDRGGRYRFCINQNNMKLYLGSQSPRRRELLGSLGFDFEVINIECDEIYPKNLPVSDVAAFLSELKAKAFRSLEKSEVLLTADTVVVFENKILGKPKSSEEAKEMLKTLSGKTHQVYTAVSSKTHDKILTQTDVADVSFLDISEEEIDFYVDKFQPMDKAGSYGIQEWLGMAKIDKINGNFYTIMGLPTAVVYSLLKKAETE